MKVTSEQFKTKAENQYGAVYKIKALVDGIEITDEIQDFEYSAMANPDGEFTFGNTCASQISFKIDTPSQNLTDREITIQQGIDIDGVVEYVNIGVFKVLKPENTRSVYTYQCVDRMVSRMEMPYFSELTYPATDVAVLNEICTQVGIGLDNANNLIPHTLQSAPSGYTRREIIGYMAQLQGKNAIINGNGNLELKWYNNVNYTIDDDRIYLDGSDSIKDETNYILGYIECSVSTSSDEEIKTIKSGTGNIGIKTENPFMTQEILDEVFSVIGGFSFMPLEVQFLGDFRLEVGDIVTVETYGKTYQVPIMQLTHSSDGGVVTTIESVAETDTENEISFTSPITKAMERYYAELVLINKALVNKLGVEELDAAKAEIEQAIIVSLDTQYAKIDFANIDTAKVDTNIVSLLLAEVGLIDRATIVEGHVTKLLDAVEINANSIKSGTIVTDRLLLSGAEGSILFELNNLGELTSTNVNSLDGYVITDRTINADKIIANSITANEIDVEDVFAQDITATGTIRGAKFVGGNLKSDNFKMQGSDVVSGMEIDLVNGDIWSPSFKLVNENVELKNLKVSNYLNFEPYEYEHETYGTITRYFQVRNDTSGIDSFSMLDSINSGGIYQSITLSPGCMHISGESGSIIYYHDGLIVQDTLSVTGATTLESTLNVTDATTLDSTLEVKDKAFFDKALVLSADGLEINHGLETGNIFNYSSASNTYYLLGTEVISDYVVSIGHISKTKEIQARARVKFYTETYSSIIFNNGTNTYFLLTDSGSTDFNSLRPLTITNATGAVTMNTPVTMGSTLDVNGRVSAKAGIEIYGSTPFIDFHYNNSTSNYNVRLMNSNSGELRVQGHLIPSDGGIYTSGITGARWKEVWCTQSSINSTSDRNLKKDINIIKDDYDKFYDALNSVSYRFKDGESNRLHIGFISQDVEEALIEAGLTALDFAGFCKDIKKREIIIKDDEYDENGRLISCKVTEWVDEVDEDGNLVYEYGLRYSEFIALNTNQIQKLKFRVNALEEENRELKETINNVLLRLQVLEERG